MFTLNEARKLAGLPPRKLQESKKLSSDELKAKLKVPEKDKGHLAAANFRFVGRGSEHIDDRYHDENHPDYDKTTDTYDSNVDDWYMRAVVFDDGRASLIWSKKQEPNTSDVSEAGDWRTGDPSADGTETDEQLKKMWNDFDQETKDAFGTLEGFMHYRRGEYSKFFAKSKK